MEKVHRATRGLPGCLRLRFPAQLPKAIPPERSAERRPQPRPGGAALSSAPRAHPAANPRPLREGARAGREGRAVGEGRRAGGGGGELAGPGRSPRARGKGAGEKLSAEAVADFPRASHVPKIPKPGKNRKRNIGISLGSNESPRRAMGSARQSAGGRRRAAGRNAPRFGASLLGRNHFRHPRRSEQPRTPSRFPSQTRKTPNSGLDFLF